MKLSARALTLVIIISSLLSILILTYPVMIKFVIGAITGAAIDSSATSIAIIGGADGPTTVIQSYAGTASLAILRYGLLGVCAAMIVFSAIKLHKISKKAAE